MLDPSIHLLPTRFPEVRRSALESLQVNLGYLCNQRCLHCHVAAGPDRTEQMDQETVDLVLDFLAHHHCKVLDLTGGAPEMHPLFRQLVGAARRLGVEVIDRCNLTILSQPGEEDLARFLAEQSVSVVASLPCYLEENVDAQRGRGSYAASITGLKKLNDEGYGMKGGLTLDLVYNPGDASLPPEQSALEADYKERLMNDHGIHFSRLLTITNMPIHRFGSTLLSRGEFEGYLALLKGAFQPANLATLMCRRMVSVDWRGFLYDCDFNQMLGLPAYTEGDHPAHLRDLRGRPLEGNPIRVAEHCYGCTAGQGSSCGGALQG